MELGTSIYCGLVWAFPIFIFSSFHTKAAVGSAQEMLQRGGRALGMPRRCCPGLMNNFGAEFPGSSGAPALAPDPIADWDLFFFAFQPSFGLCRRALGAEGSGLALPGSPGTAGFVRSFCGAEGGGQGGDAGLARSAGTAGAPEPPESFQWVFSELTSSRPTPSLPALPWAPLWCQTVAKSSS